MDIAKIRKKIKEKELNVQQTKPEKQTQEGTESKILTPEEDLTEAKSNTLIDEAQKTEKGERFKDKPKDKEGTTEVKDVKNKEEEKVDDIVEILTFRLLKEDFAIEVSQLAEIIRPQKITVVPKLPKYILGITSLRGKIIPVLDLKVKLALTEKPLDINSQGKILIIIGPKGLIGAKVDKVVSVIRISRNEIVPPPSHLTETELKFIEGVAVVDKHFVSIINTEEVVRINIK